MTQQNFLNPNGFNFNLKRLPDVRYFVQGASMPGVDISAIPRPTPFRNLNIPGNNMEYGDISLTVKADAHLLSYRQTFDWMTGLAFPDSYDQYKSLSQDQYGITSDASLIILDNRSNPVISVNFKDVYPTSLSEVEFSTTESDLTAPTFTITFKHNGYYFVDKL